jgi:hypothetical protein
MSELPSSNQPSNLPQLLRDAERRVNEHVWGDRRAIVSIPADVSRDVDILLLTAADEVERLRNDVALLQMLQQTMEECIGVTEEQSFEARAEELMVTEVQHQQCSGHETTVDDPETVRVVGELGKAVAARDAEITRLRKALNGNQHHYCKIQTFVNWMKRTNAQLQNRRSDSITEKQT